MKRVYDVVLMDFAGSLLTITGVDFHIAAEMPECEPNMVA